MPKRRRSTSDIAHISSTARGNSEVQFAAERTPTKRKRFRSELSEDKIMPPPPTPHPHGKFKSRSSRLRDRRFSLEESIRRGTKRDRAWEAKDLLPIQLPQEEMLVQYMEWEAEYDERLPDRADDESEIRFGIAVDIAHSNSDAMVDSVENSDYLGGEDLPEIKKQ